MTFLRTTWTPGQPPGLGATQLNRLETGIWVAEAPVVDNLPAAINGWNGLGSGPVDGSKVILRVKKAGAVVAYWQFVYDATNSPTYPWVFIGGAPRTEEIAGGGNTPSVAAYGNLTSGAFPVVTIGYSGEFVIGFGCTFYFSNNGGPNPAGGVSPEYGYTAANDADGSFSGPGQGIPSGQQMWPQVSRFIKRTMADGTASDITLKFRAAGNPTTAPVVQNAWLNIIPVRLGNSGIF